MKKFKTFSEEQDLNDFEEDVTCMDKTVRDKDNSKDKKEENNENV
jgi:hypothetical protein|tara:strand:+ start:667 stop:801 length:135 start_codon:yes stop_codon:yes gene_type:complete